MHRSKSPMMSFALAFPFPFPLAQQLRLSSAILRPPRLQTLPRKRQHSSLEHS